MSLPTWGCPKPGGGWPKLRCRAISLVIRECGLTQQESAALLGIDQPKVPAIARGRLAHFSRERLLILAQRLGMDIDIAVAPNLEPSRPPRMAVHRTEGFLATSCGMDNSEAMRID